MDLPAAGPLPLVLAEREEAEVVAAIDVALGRQVHLETGT